MSEGYVRISEVVMKHFGNSDSGEIRFPAVMYADLSEEIRRIDGERFFNEGVTPDSEYRRIVRVFEQLPKGPKIIIEDFQVDKEGNKIPDTTRVVIRSI